MFEIFWEKWLKNSIFNSFLLENVLLDDKIKIAFKEMIPIQIILSQLYFIEKIFGFIELVNTS